jgi:hypothetical protein
MRDDEPCLLEDPKVLHDRDAAHLRQRLCQLTQRLAIALIEPIEEHPSRGVRQGPERRVVLLHDADNMSPNGYMSIDRIRRSVDLAGGYEKGMR